MACAVKKTFHSTVPATCFISLLLEKFLNRLMHISIWNSCANLFEPDILSAQDRIVKPSRRFARATANHRARDVAKITGLLRTWENIQNNQFIRAKRAVTAFVRVATLFAACHN